MTVVTVTEARDQLPELLRRVAAGEEVVMTEDERPVAVLGPVPAELLPPDPAAEAKRRAGMREFIRSVIERREEAGVPVPEDSPLRQALAELAD